MEIAMSNKSFTSTPPLRIARNSRQGFMRIVFGTIGAFAMLLASTRPAEAQSPPQPPAAWEFYVSGGWLMPTGAERTSIKKADLTAVVVSYVPRPSFAITGTFEWARSHGLAVAGEPKLDVFICDVGAEARGTELAMGGAWRVA